eukprot:scaffold9352_cov123-Skeletonema_marinoi.AAC.12
MIRTANYDHIKLLTALSNYLPPINFSLFLTCCHQSSDMVLKPESYPPSYLSSEPLQRLAN